MKRLVLTAPLLALLLSACPSGEPAPKADPPKSDNADKKADSADKKADNADKKADSADKKADSADKKGEIKAEDPKKDDGKKADGKKKLTREQQREKESAKSKAGDLLNEGRKLVQDKNFAEGRAKLIEASKLRPNDAEVLGELGWATYQAGDLEAARSITQRALNLETLDKRKGAMLYNLGRICEDKGDLSGAVDNYRRSLAVRPDNAIVQKRLDDLLGKSPDLKKGNMADVCTQVSQEWDCAKLGPESEEEGSCACVQQQVLQPVGDKGGFVSAGLISLKGATLGQVDQLYLAVETPKGGWQVVAMVVNNYTPGAFGIFNEGKVESFEFRDVVPGGHQELVLTYAQDSYDGNFDHAEYWNDKGQVVCWFEKQPTCISFSLLRAWGLTTEDFEQAPPEDGYEPPKPFKKEIEYSASFEPDGKLKVTKVKADEVMPDFDQLEGTRTLSEAAKLPAYHRVELR